MNKDTKELKRELNLIVKKAHELYDSINIAGKSEELKDLEAETFKEGFWNDQEKSTRVSKAISNLKKKIQPWNDFIKEIDDAEELLEIAISENDNSMIQETCQSLTNFNNRFSELETMELLADPDDPKNAFVSIHPGAGGTESQDWASMLLRMYVRWAESKNFKVEYVEYMPGDEAGIKSVTIMIKGEYTYGFLKGEMGVHRLVRISPFDSNKRRHTSFASVEVIPEITEDIEIDINESELRIDTYRASGAGGQHVNTTDSAVRITHLPTGIVVSCQNERSQHKNKSFAMKVLKAKLYEEKRKELLSKAEEKSGDKKEIAWGSQIRSYVYQPYTMVKDHRTEEETGSVEHVMDGSIDRFIYAYLKLLTKKN